MEVPDGSTIPTRRGIAAVELAIFMPFLLFLLLGLWEVGRMVQVSQIVNNAAREGARKASTSINTYSDVSTVVTNYLKCAGITNLTNLQINVANITQSSTGTQYDPSQASYLDQIQVTVLLPFDNVGWTVLDTFTNSSTKIAGQANWYSNQDQNYPTTVVPPPGY